MPVTGECGRSDRNTDLRRPPSARLFAVGLGVAILSLALFAWLGEEVLRGRTVAFDSAIRADLHRLATPALTSAMRFFTALGSTFWLLAMSVGVVAVLVRAHWRRGTALFLIGMGGGAILDGVLKVGFGRPRPQVSFFGTPIPHSYSFPSGHALLSVCFFGMAAALAASRVHGRAGRILIWLTAAVIAFAIGFSRVYLGVHYASDVIAGYAAAIVWIGAIAYGNRLIRRPAGGTAQR
jgi:undecaprenyl-diphosphatase